MIALRTLALRAANLHRWWLALALTSLLMACAELPKDVQRPVSNALTSVDGTSLAAMVQDRRKADAAPFESGFLMLDGPQSAYGARLALVDGAQKTLDLQYYAIHADASSARLLRAVRTAAARGVRVRLLLDDFHSTGRDALVMRMAFEPNIEMRMFNPLAGARGSTIGRLFNALDDAGDLQQRMHNKLFIADNVMAVTGGRNLGDAYFGNDTDANFVDLDVLSVGPIVKDFSRSFDEYWNNERAYPVQSLVTREELDKIRDKARSAREAADAAQTAKGEDPKPTDGDARPAEAGPTPEQRARAWDEQAMDLRTVKFVWAPAVVLADRPSKIPADTTSQSATLPPQKESGLVITKTAATSNTVKEIANDDNVVDGLLSLFQRARSDLTIVSPYFVPGQDMLDALSSLRARGVRIRVLTNSLASNDAAAAHAGYARHRKALLAMGLDLYEMRSEQASGGASLGSSGASIGGSSRSMLHTKALTIDGRLVVVGSMNLDLRSQLQNTEVGLLIRSETLAKATNERIEAAFREGAWHVQLVDGQLIWRAPPQSQLADTTTEPDTPLRLRLMIDLFGPLAPDKLL
ncbi:phospholipase D family protein [Variovorax sp. J22R133]|uniref:phospholipase D family protein n=1 Tax=Variovorax brevis TaxID=3053503 RepID=UPI002575C255|nr:phospholipase D family protein [Variovorax sp. J22R133]MDM0117117.1 phospholipase D family protein [Variovorax sp. J22R133]